MKMKEVEVERLATVWNNPAVMWIVLKEKQGDGRVHMCFNHFDGSSIIMGLENLQHPRPWTHDLLLQFTDKLGGAIKHVVITELRENTFYATVEVQSNGSTHVIDARPSDALALAVRQKVPLFAEEAVLDCGEDEAAPMLPLLSTVWPFRDGDSKAA
jgi:bifunctional DNase/RNase